MAKRSDKNSEAKEELSIADAGEYLLEECRMVLPGIQALFGFQLVAIFNQRFGELLSAGEQKMHLLAIGLVAIAVAFIMTPAAFHRQQGARAVTETFLQVSTRLLLWSMLPLALGICLDFYLIARIIIDGVAVPLLAAALFVVFFSLWFVLPRARGLQRIITGN